MKRRSFIQSSAVAGLGLGLPLTSTLADASKRRVGIIGLDTSHAPAFTKLLQADEGDFQVTHAYPHGSMDIESSVSRIPQYTEELKRLGVHIVDSIAELLDQVEFVLLETNDGRLHLEQALEVFEAKKPVFIDKPLAASFSDCKAIFEAAKSQGVPLFSASSLRFGPATQAVAKGSIGNVLGADTYSPAKLESTHPDLFWYGIHGVESLFTVMGTGCKEVSRIFTDGWDIVTGTWKDGRIGTFRGLRKGKTTYGGTAFGTEGIAPVGAYEGYAPLVAEIQRFFLSGATPVSPEETLEIFAFMTAAELSKKRMGARVSLKEVWE